VPERALGAPFKVAFVIPDANERHLVTVANGVMVHELGADDAADATLTVPRLALIAMVGGRAKAADLMQAGTLKIEGSPAVLQRFLTLFEPPHAGFPLMTPLALPAAVSPTTKQ
jgi:alkyl sulfatase BDS1-like metallo-beta-lactamase superfamily hydrolase